MQKRIPKNKNTSFICPFCKNNIVASKKTEVLYRSVWVDACSDCYIQSIEKSTHSSFQSRTINELL